MRVKRLGIITGAFFFDDHELLELTVLIFS